MKIREKVASWDQEQGQERTSGEAAQMLVGTSKPSYAEILDRLEALAHCGFDQYDQNISGSFAFRLAEWLEQFSKDEQPYAFLAASRILFVTREQQKALQRCVYERKIRRMLLEQILRRQELPSYRHDLAEESLRDELNHCFFSDLSTSARIDDFMHVNRADFDGHAGRDRRLSGASVETLVRPIKEAEQGRQAWEDAIKQIDALATQYLVGKTHLFIVEDFAGSGQTVTSDLERLIVYSERQSIKIVFCPYICTQRTKDTIAQNEALNRAGGIEVLYGILLPESASAFTPGTYLWDEYDLPEDSEFIRTELQAVCQRYFETHHYLENLRYKEDLSDIRINAGGYRSCQLLIVQYSNVPNNSLPIIWSDKGEPEAWKPLFHRSRRY